MTTDPTNKPEVNRGSLEKSSIIRYEDDMHIQHKTCNNVCRSSHFLLCLRPHKNVTNVLLKFDSVN